METDQTPLEKEDELKQNSEVIVKNIPVKVQTSVFHLKSFRKKCQGI